MPDRFLRSDLTKEERVTFFNMIEIGVLRYTIVIAICISLIMAVVVSIPVAIIVNDNTVHVNRQAHNENCRNINAIDDTLIGVIKKSPPKNKKQEAAKEDLLAKLNKAHCKYI